MVWLPVQGPPRPATACSSCPPDTSWWPRRCVPARPVRTRRPRRSRGCRQTLDLPQEVSAGPLGGVDHRDAGPLAGRVGQGQLLGEDQPERDDPEEQEQQDRGHQRELDRGRPLVRARAGRPPARPAPGPLSRARPCPPCHRFVTPARTAVVVGADQHLPDRAWCGPGRYRRTASPRSTVRARRRPASFRRIAPNDRLGL